MRARVVSLMVAVALVVSACGTGTEEAASDGGSGSGIGVHGAWTLDVYDTDGSLDRSVQFNNGLQSSGAALLAEILAGQATPGSWKLILGKADGETTDPCTFSDGRPSPCGASATVEVPTPGELVLSAAMTIEADTSVGRVGSQVQDCPSSTAPDDCLTGASGNGFTSKTAASDPTDDFEPVPVTAGQTVQVRVELTFGTLP